MSGVAALAVGSSLFFFLSPNIKSICYTFNNCSRNVEYQIKYEEIAERAEPLILEAASDDNLNSYDWQKLKTLQSKLEEISRELATIPVSAKIYDDVEQTLVQIQTQVERVHKAMTLELPDNMFVNPQVDN